MPDRSPEHPSIHGQLTDSIEEAIRISKTLPTAHITVPLLEAMRDGRMTPPEAGVERERQLLAEDEGYVP